MPAGVLPPQQMQAVLWDVIRADVFTADYIKKDSSRNAVKENEKLQQQIFAIHKITAADFYTSYDYYKNHTAEFMSIIDTLVARAERNKIVKPNILQAE
jgi:hypothetical protein